MAINDQNLYDAESRMSLLDALRVCGVIDAVWTDEDTGDAADHSDPTRGYYEAYLPSGERITANDRYCPGSLGDVWHADDTTGGGHEIDTPEFAAATIRFVGGPRDGETVS